MQMITAEAQAGNGNFSQSMWTALRKRLVSERGAILLQL
jgi:hypothetical protein